MISSDPDRPRYGGFQLGIKFYLLFLMEVWMTEGPRMNFVSRFSKFTRESSVFHTSMRNKQEEFNPHGRRNRGAQGARPPPPQ